MRVPAYFLAIALLAAGCANTGESPSPTWTPVEVTPTLQQTPEGMTMPHTITSADGSIEVGYSEGWVASSQESNTVVISNDEALLDTPNISTIPSDKAVMFIGTTPRDNLTTVSGGLSGMAQAIASSLSSSLGSEGAPTFGDAAVMEIRGYPAVTITGTLERTDNNPSSDIHIILIDQEDTNTIVQLVMLTASGASARFEGEAQNVAGSVRTQQVSSTEVATATP